MLTTKLQAGELSTLLSHKYKSAEGLDISPMDAHWRLSMSSSVVVAAELAERAFEEDVRPYFRIALARYASTRKADTVVNVTTFLSVRRQLG